MRDILSCLSVEVFLKKGQAHCVQTSCLNLKYLRLLCLSLLAEQEDMGQYCQRGEHNVTNLTVGFGLHLSNVHSATALHYLYVHLSPA